MKNTAKALVFVTYRKTPELGGLSPPRPGRNGGNGAKADHAVADF
jgi:hypothetical protein